MIKLPEPAYSGVAHSVETGDTPSTRQRTTVIVEGLPSYSSDQLKQAIRDALVEASRVCDAIAMEAERASRSSLLNSGWDTTLASDIRAAQQAAPAFNCATAILRLKEDIQ